MFENNISKFQHDPFSCNFNKNITMEINHQDQVDLNEVKRELLKTSNYLTLIHLILDLSERIIQIKRQLYPLELLWKNILGLHK